MLDVISSEKNSSFFFELTLQGVFMTIVSYSHFILHLLHV